MVIVRGEAGPDLLAELGLPRNAIVKRNGENLPSGTGPFRVVDWKPGKNLALAADENCWRGRPFLDAVEIEMGETFRDQMAAMEMGKADLMEVAPEQTQSVSQEGRGLIEFPTDGTVGAGFRAGSGVGGRKAFARGSGVEY